MDHKSPDVVCSHPGCDKKIRGHAWGHIKASDWFFQKDGQSWCPDHHPEWVAEWRATQRETQWDLKLDKNGNVLRAKTKKRKS